MGDKNKFWATGVDRLTMRKSVVVSTVKGRSVLAPKLAQCSTKALLAPSGNDAATMLTLSTFRSFAFRLEGTTKQFGSRVHTELKRSANAVALTNSHGMPCEANKQTSSKHMIAVHETRQRASEGAVVI